MEGLWPIAHNSVITYLSLQPQCHFGWKTKKDAHFIYHQIYMYFPYICSSISRLRHRAWRRLCATERTVFFIFRVNRNRAPLRVHICPAKNDRRWFLAMHFCVWPYIFCLDLEKKNQAGGVPYNGLSHAIKQEPTPTVKMEKVLTKRSEW
jgi:hypothetical protein